MSKQPFIGRAHELNLLREWSLGPGRLMTVVGPPGAGKTTLASQCESILEWFSLVEVDDAAQLVSAIAAQLGLESTVGIEEVARLLDEHPPGVVVLDNLEHLLPGASDTVDALFQRTSEHISVLCTSRTRLMLPDEQVLDVRGLQTEPGSDGPSEAATCFVSRAKLSNASFDPSPAEWVAIESLATFVDGLPLALELAAGRVGLLSVIEIRERIADHFELLGHGTSRDRRHQTMHAAVAWSWSLLSEAQQHALEMLCIAEKVTLDEAADLLQLSAIDTLSSLQSLNDASLIYPASVLKITAFRPYAIVRAFVLDARRLNEEVITRLGQCVTRFIEVCARRGRVVALEFIKTRDAASLERARETLPSLVTALRYLDAHRKGGLENMPPDPAVLAQCGVDIGFTLLVLASTVPVFGLDHFFECIEQCPRDQLPTEKRLLFEVYLAYYLRSRKGQGERASAIESEVRGEVEALPGSAIVAEVWILLAIGSLKRGQTDHALVAQAVAIASDEGSPAQFAFASMLQGTIAYIEDDYPTSVQRFESALHTARTAGAEVVSVKVLSNLALVLSADNQLPAALLAARQVIEAAETVGTRSSAAWSHKFVADTLLAAGAAAQAIDVYDVAIQLLKRVSAVDGVAFALHTLARAHLELGDVRSAEVVLERLTSHLTTANMEVHGDHYNLLRGLIYMENGDYAAAQRAFVEAREWVVPSHVGWGQTIDSLVLLVKVLNAPRTPVAEIEEQYARLDPADSSRHALVARLNLAVARIVTGNDETGPLRQLLLQSRGIRHWEVREAVFRLLHVLEPPARRTLLAEAIDPQQAMLLAERGGAFVRVPRGDWVDLSTRPTLAAILSALVDARASDTELDVYALTEAAWPGEQIDPEAASNRVYNAIATLRKRGLKDAIVKGEQGYTLNHAVAWLEPMSIWPLPESMTA